MARTLSIPILLLLGGFGVGCASPGPAVPPVPVYGEPWPEQGGAAQKLVTDHYVVYSTLDDRELAESVARLMEGALAQYAALAPAFPLCDGRMECYLFQSRDQWVAFTESRTGSKADMYLQINRGGYTVRDWYVAYFIGDVGTHSVAAHEGFHQYVGRHFVSRLPPFLEEGLACMFEDIRWCGSGEPGSPRAVPRWTLDGNRSRLQSLRNVVESGSLIPLAELAEMHAGRVVNGPRDGIDAFYAQSWAFAKFLWEAEHGKYRPVLYQILSDAADGTLFPGNNVRDKDGGLWDPDEARPLLEYYLRSDVPSIDAAYRAYVKQLASRGYRPPET